MYPVCAWIFSIRTHTNLVTVIASGNEDVRESGGKGRIRITLISLSYCFLCMYISIYARLYISKSNFFPEN